MICAGLRTFVIVGILFIKRSEQLSIGRGAVQTLSAKTNTSKRVDDSRRNDFKIV